MSGRRPPPPRSQSSTEELAPKGELRFRRFRVTVTDGPDLGLESTADGSEFAIGTAEGNQLVLKDPAVSRHHCVITATEHGFHLRDLDSTNGTFLSGYRVGSAYLEHAAPLRIGTSSLSFVCLNDELSEPLSSEMSFGTVLG